MLRDPRFVDGWRYGELYATPKGFIVVEALVSVMGTTLRLSDLLVEPFEFPHLPIGPEMVFSIRRQLLLYAREEGYTTVDLVGYRTSGANPDRHFALRRHL